MLAARPAPGSATRSRPDASGSSTTQTPAPQRRPAGQACPAGLRGFRASSRPRIQKRQQPPGTVRPYPEPSTNLDSASHGTTLGPGQKGNSYPSTRLRVVLGAPGDQVRPSRPSTQAVLVALARPSRPSTQAVLVALARPCRPSARRVLVALPPPCHPWLRAFLEVRRRLSLLWAQAALVAQARPCHPWVQKFLAVRDRPSRSSGPVALVGRAPLSHPWGQAGVAEQPIAG